MKKRCSPTLPIGTLVISCIGRMNVLSIDLLTERMTWDYYDPGVMIYVGCLKFRSGIVRATILLPDGNIKHAFYDQLAGID